MEKPKYRFLKPEKMKKIVQKENEDRKEYLARVMVAYLEQWPEETLVYDDAECDGYCLAEDIKNEFYLEDE